MTQCRGPVCADSPGRARRSRPNETPSIRVAATAVAILAAASLAACSSSSKSTPSSGNTTGSAGTPVSGGTLRWVASGDVDHLDPMSAYYTATAILERGYTRQLVTYPSSNMDQTATTIAPDVATEVPTRQNGGISSDGLTYTFHLRPGVMVEHGPPRAVVAGDFVRALKRFCNPVLGVGNPTYFTALSRAWRRTAPLTPRSRSTSTAAQLANFQNSHTISGVSAPNATTLVIKLSRPGQRLPQHHGHDVRVRGAGGVGQRFLPDSAAFPPGHVYSDGPYSRISQMHGGQDDRTDP